MFSQYCQKLVAIHGTHGIIGMDSCGQTTCRHWELSPTTVTVGHFHLLSSGPRASLKTNKMLFATNFLHIARANIGWQISEYDIN